MAAAQEPLQPEQERKTLQSGISRLKRAATPNEWGNLVDEHP
jgi:hypothetical protein